MYLYLLRRLLMVPVLLFLVVTISFGIMRMAPGDPLQQEKNLDPAVRQALMEKYDFDKSLTQQYLTYLGNVLGGDFGPSYTRPGKSVNALIAENLPVSLTLGALALVFALAIGLCSGIISGIRQHSLIDYTSMSLAMFGLSIPTFVVGPFLAWWIGGKLGWLPIAGMGEGGLRPLILPAITIALPFAARIARLTRAGMLEVINQDYVRCAMAKGLSESRVVFAHCLRAALVPVIGFLGPAIAALLTGSLVVEKIFQIPGLGRLFVEDAINRDYTVVMGTVIVYGALLILANLLSDLLYAVCDPRVRHEH